MRVGALIQLETPSDVRATFSFRFGLFIHDLVVHPLSIRRNLGNLRRLVGFQRPRVRSHDQVDPLIILDSNSIKDRHYRFAYDFALNHTDPSRIIEISTQTSILGSVPFLPPGDGAMTKERWNNHFSILLTTMLTSAPSSRLIYVGAYPYAGLLSVIRKITSNGSTIWVRTSDRGQQVLERGSVFSMIEDIETWIDMSRSVWASRSHSTVHVDQPESDFGRWVMSAVEQIEGLNQSEDVERSRFRVISHGDSDEVFDAIEAGHLVISPASMPLSKKFIPLTKDMLSSNLLLIQHGAYGDQALRDFLSHPKRLGENRRVESSNWRPIEQMLNESQIG